MAELVPLELQRFEHTVHLGGRATYLPFEEDIVLVTKCPAWPALIGAVVKLKSFSENLWCCIIMVPFEPDTCQTGEIAFLDPCHLFPIHRAKKGIFAHYKWLQWCKQGRVVLYNDGHVKWLPRFEECQEQASMGTSEDCFWILRSTQLVICFEPSSSMPHGNAHVFENFQGSKDTWHTRITLEPMDWVVLLPH